MLSVDEANKKKHFLLTRNVPLLFTLGISLALQKDKRFKASLESTDAGGKEPGGGDLAGRHGR